MLVESEKKLDDILAREIKKRKGLYLKIEPIHNRGIPDRFCFLPMGIFYLIELKTTKKTTSPIQKAFHKMLNKVGFKVLVIDQSIQIKNLLQEYDNNEK